MHWLKRKQHTKPNISSKAFFYYVAKIFNIAIESPHAERLTLGDTLNRRPNFRPVVL